MRCSPFDAIGTSTLLERLTSQQALQFAGIDFDVVLKPVMNSITGSVVTENDEPKYYQVIRSDTNDVLGIVEGRFTPLQNRDVFALADALVETGARIVRVVEIEQGSRCFMTVEWDETISVKGDTVRRRAIIQNAHNGKYAAMIRLMPLRQLSHTGLIVPIPTVEFEFRIKHTVGSTDQLLDAQEVIAKADEYFNTFTRAAEYLARLPVDRIAAEEILWSVPDFRGKRSSPNMAKKVGRIMSLFSGEQAGAETEALKGTTWGLLNAVSEFADYDEESRVRVTKGTTAAVQRFKSAFGGTNQRLKMGFFETLLRDNRLNGGLKLHLPAILAGSP